MFDLGEADSCVSHGCGRRSVRDSVDPEAAGQSHYNGLRDPIIATMLPIRDTPMFCNDDFIGDVR